VTGQLKKISSSQITTEKGKGGGKWAGLIPKKEVIFITALLRKKIPLIADKGPAQG